MEAILEAGSGEEQRESAPARVRTTPAKYAPWIESVVLIVCAKCRRWRDSRGWNRRATIRPPSWRRCAGPAESVPATEVRGEGLFLRLSEAKVSDCGSSGCAAS